MKKGFTLIELLGTILILSAIVLIVAPLIINQVTSGREMISEKNKESIIMSAKNWANDNKGILPDDNDSGSVYIDLLQKEGYLEEDIQDVSDNDCVVISNHDGAYYYEYHTKDDKDENGDSICGVTAIYKIITLDAGTNSGKVNGKAVDVIYGTEGEKIELPDAVSNKSGFNFIGWSANSSTTEGNKEDENYIVPDKNVTLYAIFKKPAISYKLTTNANGGSGTANNSSCTIPAVYNNATQKTSCTAVLPNNNFTRENYDFVGWNENKNASSGSSPGSTVSLSSDKVYYAIWEKTSYKVTYDYSTNGGSSSSVTSKMTKIGENVDLTPTAKKSGWTFVGWNTDKDAHIGLETYTMPEKNVTLYAIYKKSQKSYYITTNANGGSGTAYSSSCTIPAVYNNATQKTSCTAVLPSNGFSRSGYTFNGWSTNSSASSGYSPGTAVTLSSNKTYYATWKKNQIIIDASYLPESYYCPSGYTQSGSGASMVCRKTLTTSATKSCKSVTVSTKDIVYVDGYNQCGSSGEVVSYTDNQQIIMNKGYKCSFSGCRSDCIKNPGGTILCNAVCQKGGTTTRTFSSTLSNNKCVSTIKVTGTNTCDGNGSVVGYSDVQSYYKAEGYTCDKSSYYCSSSCSGKASGYTYNCYITCTRSVSASGSNVKYSCPSGYSLSGSTCKKTDIRGPNKTGGYYYCPSGYTLSGKLCYKD